MSDIKDLEKRVEHLETEVELLKELIKLYNNKDNVIPPFRPYYDRPEPTLDRYKITCGDTK